MSNSSSTLTREYFTIAFQTNVQGRPYTNRTKYGTKLRYAARRPAAKRPAARRSRGYADVVRRDAARRDAARRDAARRDAARRMRLGGM